MEYDYDICWDETALRALRKTFNYLKRHISASAAQKLRSDVFAAIEKVVENPEHYSYDRLLLENPPRYRAIPVGGYRVVYEFKHETVFILLIYHSRQNPEKVRKSMP